MSFSPSLAFALSRGSAFVRRTGVPDLFLVAVAFLLYSVVRQMAGSSAANAFAHSFDVIEIEQSLGIFQEARLQEWAMSSEALVRFFNFVYTYGHFPLIGIVGVWLFVFFRDRYYLFRNAFFAAGAIGLAAFNLFPMAPPRLMPLEYGLVDTLSLFQRVNYHSTGDFVNPYAAMPSMHIAFNLIVCLAIATACSGMRRPWRSLGLSFSVIAPMIMALAVIITGNHYILDIVAGYAVAALGVWTALLFKELGERARQVPASA